MLTYALLLVVTTAMPPPGLSMSPLNGLVYSGDPVGYPLTVGAYAIAPYTPLEIQVLKRPGLDPTLDANWVVLATMNTDPLPIRWNANSPVTLYYAVTQVTPVPSNPTPEQAARWPPGKFVQLRILAKDYPGNQVLPTFDVATFFQCSNDNLETNWVDFVTICGSAFPGAAVMSTVNNPADLHAGVNTYNYLGRKGDATQLATLLYYATSGLPSTLNGFKQQYDFPTNEASAVYYNEADLGFGREMHCKSFDTLLGTGVACYVNNYGTNARQAAFPADPMKALTLAHGGHDAFATVAMVYTPPNLVDAIKFIVYDANGQQLTTAPLDSTGAHASVPNNCLGCHGLNSTAYLVQNPALITVSQDARFLPFDPFSFKYLGEGDSQAQREGFRKLNALVALTPMSPATSQFIQGLYGGKQPSDPTAVATDRFIPFAWNTNNADRTIYMGVVKPFCRGCHMTSTSSSLDFDSPSDFAPQYVHEAPCSSSHLMPHAEQTLRLFWNSGARAYLTQRYQVANACSP
ncbi:hypothetical protein LY474_30540 [Myxococcus stipitatus]|uniref:hypothetical protein n=1 Tax=Myxococcus stipitatus TaxID=83455 RepID=UPI001F35ACAD|nr:hypothetical protein [Myxococcus stipitatus]MCE9672154.1 hypothetical protein [Myxococcus stipitatus]